MALQASQVSMREIAEAVFRNKWIFLLCLLAGVAGGWIRAAGLPRLYRADAVLTAQDRDDSNPVLKNIGVTTPLDKRVAEIRSRVLSGEGGSLAELAKSLNLSDYRPENPAAAANSLKGSANFLLRGINLTITVSRTGPKGGEDAAKIANGLADRMVSLSCGTGLQATSSTKHLVESLRVKYQDRVTSAEQQLRQFESINSIDLDASPADLARSVKGLSVSQPETNALIAQFQDLANRRMTNEIQLSGLRSKLQDIDRQIATEPEYRTVEMVQTRPEVQNDVQKAYAKAQMELRALRDAGRSDEHPAVQEKQAEVDDLKAQVDSLAHPVVQEEKQQVNNVLENLRVDRSKLSAQIAELESAQADLQAHLDSLGPRIRQIPDKEAERQRLQTKLQIQQGIYRDLSTRYEHADLSDELMATDIQVPLLSVLVHAVPPAAPFSPNTKFIILMGGFIGIIVGVVGSFLREILDTSFHSLEDASRYLDLPVLGVIPEVVATRRRPIRRSLH